MIQQKRQSEGFSLVELLIVVLVLGIIAAIAIPNLLATRRSANEGSALSSLRILHGAQMLYQTSVGAGNYAGTNSSTGDTVGVTTLSAAKLIDPVLGSGAKSGYQFVGAISLAGAGTPATFYFSAKPASPSGTLKSGTVRYCITQQGFLGYDTANLGTSFDATTVASATPLD